ncbi:MAG: helix-turn-helix transcriptional regulator [Halococcoides sp.]
MPPRSLAVILVVAFAAAIGGVAAGAGEPIETHQTMTIGLQTDGDARWEVTTQLSLRNESDRAAFDRVADRFEAGEIEIESLAAARTAAEMASESTGREMAIAGVEYRATSTNEAGELTVAFTWENFARVEEDAIYVGDAFDTDDRWLAELGANQTLIVDPPAGYGPTDWEHGMENGQSRIEGPHTFSSGGLSGTFVGSGIGAVGWVPAAVVVFGLILALGWWLSTRRPDRSSPGESADPDPESDPAPDPELLSDEERVEALLERNGGRMKQARIVEETGWSNAKASQLLSKMAENDRVDKLRLGRENVISLPGEDHEQ